MPVATATAPEVFVAKVVICEASSLEAKVSAVITEILAKLDDIASFWAALMASAFTATAASAVFEKS